MRKAWIYIISLVLTVAACSATAANRRPLSEEERLFRANCRSCHLLPDPRLHTDEQWPAVVKRYAEPIKLSVEQQAAIVRFLQESN